MTNIEEVRGVTFNLQHYSIHDGPGIRTTVFLKGCPLRCVWCQNPESQDFKPVIFLNLERCTGCGTCVNACPEAAIQIIDGKSKTDRKLCKGHGQCAEVCPNEARSLMGKYMTAREVFDDVNADAIFYQNSGGGVTLSGGDPVAQPEFSRAILKLCHDAGIHTAIETSGFAKWDIFKGILEYTDLVLYDIKHMDSAKHKEYTGVPNEMILENAVRIRKELDLSMLGRLPIMPGYNDSPENMERTAQFIANDLGGGFKVHLLPYHRLGETKYARMEEPDKAVSITPPTEEHMAELVKIFESKGLETVVGG
ncbi:MAG: glycyl-radical enzyme activating protein [Deltaproteobacteria bacterium]|nr:glycyl-radical enzyme activating protein [Deltaproteobacteria bacterium]